MKYRYEHYYSKSNEHKTFSEIRSKIPSPDKSFTSDYIVVLLSSEYEELF